MCRAPWTSASSSCSATATSPPFATPEVIQAIQSGAVGKIAVTYFGAGPGFQVMIAPWTVIANAADAEGFAQKLSAGSISRETGTSISSSLYYAVGRFDNNGFTSYRQTIDVSGDGPNNAGRPIEPTRDWVVGKGITINGLPIVIRPSFTSSPFGIPNLDKYYEDCVIGGPRRLHDRGHRRREFRKLRSGGSW